VTSTTPAYDSTDWVAQQKSKSRASSESPLEAIHSPKSRASQVPSDPVAQDVKIPLLAHAIAQLAQHHSSLIRIMPNQNEAFHFEHEQHPKRASSEKNMFESPLGPATRSVQSSSVPVEKSNLSTHHCALIRTAQTQKTASLGAHQQPTELASMEKVCQATPSPKERALESLFEPDAEPDAWDAQSPLLSLADAQVATNHGSQVQHATACVAHKIIDSVSDSLPTSSYGSATPGRRVRLTGKRRIAPPVQESIWSVAAGLRTSTRLLQKVRRTRSSEIRENIGHSLSPPEQGVKVRVIGDGWGGGSGEYLATITEADSSTFTVIRCKKPSGDAGAWEETHVLRENCIPVLQNFSFENTSRGGVAKRRKRI